MADEKYFDKLQQFYDESNYQDELDQLRKERDEMREALEFYADKKNYEVYHHALSGMFDQDTRVTDDEGRIAREVLERIKSAK